MVAAVILKIHFNDYNSVAIACIYTKFGSERKTDVLEAEIPSNVTSVHIQIIDLQHAKRVHYNVHSVNRRGYQLPAAC